MIWRLSATAVAVLAFGAVALAKDTDVAKQLLDEKAEAGDGKLYFTGPGYTINLIPQAIILGILAFIAAFLFGLFSTGDSQETGYGVPSTGYGTPNVGYGAPESSYGAPEASYAAPADGYNAPASSYSAAGRYYDTYANSAAESLGAFDDRKKRSAF